MSLNRAELLNVMRLKTELVTLDDGSNVIVSEVGAADYIKLWTNPEYQDGNTVDMAKLMPAMVAYSVVDDQGHRVFADDDIPTLARSAQGPFMKISDAVRRVNGMIGEESKNSKETALGDSSTGSVSN